MSVIQQFIGSQSTGGGPFVDGSGPFSARTKAPGNLAAALALAGGAGSVASGTAGIAWGGLCVASGLAAVALGVLNTASGDESVALGTGCVASSLQAIAMGNGCSATTGDQPIAMGNLCLATGSYSFAVGDGNTAVSTADVAMGTTCTASGAVSYAHGDSCTANGGFARATGVSTLASAGLSRADGYQSHAVAVYAEATGANGRAEQDGEEARGADDLGDPTSPAQRSQFLLMAEQVGPGTSTLTLMDLGAEVQVAVGSYGFTGVIAVQETAGAACTTWAVQGLLSASAPYEIATWVVSPTIESSVGEFTLSITGILSGVATLRVTITSATVGFRAVASLTGVRIFEPV